MFHLSGPSLLAMLSTRGKEIRIHHPKRDIARQSRMWICSWHISIHRVFCENELGSASVCSTSDFTDAKRCGIYRKTDKLLLGLHFDTFQPFSSTAMTLLLRTAIRNRGNIGLTEYILIGNRDFVELGSTRWKRRGKPS
eukprot:scaffold22578_cov164-Cylindrotheca_fusiformis.AAC.10